MEIQTKDILREISNIGIGSCMTSLSHIIGKEVHYSVSCVSELENYGDMMEWFKRADEHVAGVSVPFNGDIAGSILLIYQPSMADTILTEIFGSIPKWGSMNNEMLDMIQETANIMASSYLSSLSAYTSWHIQAGCSAASTDMVGAMIGEIAGMAVKADNHVLCIGSRFGTEPDSQENCMMMMLYEHSIPGFLEALEEKKCVRL
ncbi:chemotaxis protein CheC [Clostridium sp. AM58-1XD]|uniref:chemotaxis protein CheC n=1 Tax=Clostridium sp. AM58-1XD TaxID=2292307 RepID=UPI0015F5E6C7|nr:chemotaxis protein CheC [Clostridium sp. AM58-1XD]